MKLSDAIFLGNTLKKFDSSQWLSEDGSCGCALGGAMLAVGLGQQFIRETKQRNMSSAMSAYHVPCFMEQWPWLHPSHITQISAMAHGVEDGSISLDALLDYVRSIEPPTQEEVWASIASKLPDLPLEEQHRLEDIDAEAESDWAESHLRAHFGNAGER